MPRSEEHRVSHEELVPEDSDDSTRRLRWFSWWWVWIPIIIVVILWIGGWSFGNYGGPWSPQPRSVQPQISDPGIAILNFNTMRPSLENSHHT